MKKDWLLSAFLGLLFTAGLAACAWYQFPFTESLEGKLYDLRLAAVTRGESLSDQIRLVAVDDASINQVGRWPWPRGLQGELIRRIASGGPKVIGVNIFWVEPEAAPGMDVVKQLKEKYLELLDGKKSVLQAAAKDRRLHASTLPGDLKEFAAIFDEGAAALNQDAKLTDVLSVTPRVVLPLLFSQTKPLAEEGDESLNRMPYRIKKVAAGAFDGIVPPGYAPTLPLAEFSTDVSGMGFSNLTPDADGSVRAQPVAFLYRGVAFPALPVEMARLARGLDADAVRLQPGRALFLGNKAIPLDRKSRLLIRYAGIFSADESHTVHAVDVLTDKIDPVKDFKDKIVLVAPRAAGVDPLFVTPASSLTPSADVQLNVLQNLLSDRFIVRPEWAPMAELGSLAFVGLIVMLLLPFLRAKGGALVALLLMAGFGGAGWYLFMAKGWWLKVFYPMALLALDYTTVTLRRFFFTEKRKELVEAEGIETNKMLGLSFQGQGMLDMAFEKFRRCPVDGPMKELLYNLALDFERKRQFGKASAVYEHIATTDPGYKDVKSKVQSSKQASETMIVGGGLGRTKEGGGTVVVHGSAVKPTLGRYEIEKELGRGAMGIVYLGKDPKINRAVAIKTLKFDDDLDAEAMKEFKTRFFREAESAGTLNHPNIVRIFDAGEDNEISFIAMELLEGEDLKKYTDKNNLLPVPVVLEYVALVADALDYAHVHGVVHRDVKPANIMRLKDGTLRVTDFGIARITASSKTSTGTVLGTPSYMSPEQVAGRKVDGRADLFSLGVMLFEMLTGEKPFGGESIATLLFKISHEPHPDPILIASARVSPAVKAIIDRALEKNPDQRYQKGADMARDLREAMKNPAALPSREEPSSASHGGVVPKPVPPTAPPMVPPAPRPMPPFASPVNPVDRTAPDLPPLPPRTPPPAAPPMARPPSAPAGGPVPPPPPMARPAAPPQRPPLVLPPMADFGFEILPGAPAFPATPPVSPGPGAAAPALPPPVPEPTFEIVRNPPPAFRPPARPPVAPPTEGTVRLPTPPFEIKSTEPPATGSEGTQKL